MCSKKTKIDKTKTIKSIIKKSVDIGDSGVELFEEKESLSALKVANHAYNNALKGLAMLDK